MAYSSGFLKHRITIQNRKEAKTGKFGVDSAGVEYEDVCTVWAAVDWTKGKQSMNAGALDVYGVVLIRCRYNPFINERSRIVYDGRTYQVLGETLHVDKQDNTVQLHAQQIVND